MPYFADAVQGMKKFKKSPKKSPNKKRAALKADEEEAEAGEGDAKDKEVFTTPPKPRSKNRRLRASSSDPASVKEAKTPEGSGSAFAAQEF